MSEPFRLSVAIPVHNEERVLPELLRRVRAVLDQIPGGPHELLFADDGSTDGTLALIEEAAKEDPRIVAVALSRNYGHQAALSAALDYVSGDATVVMDGDLQDVPEAIPQFLDKYAQGYDVVYAQRVRRKEPLILRICYFTFYRLMANLSDVRLPLDSGDFSLMSRRVVECLRRMPEHHRYLRGMRTWVGFKQTGIPIERDKRFAGDSKYSWMRLLRLASDGIFAFSIVPIRAAALIGAFTIAMASVYSLFAVYAKIFWRQSPKGFTAEVVLLSFLSGILLLFLGIIGEYVGRVYEETKGRPHYIVGRVVGRLNGEDPSLNDSMRRSLGNPVR
jgi:glycosyltransferase involved in cell wall biosynthesis